MTTIAILHCHISTISREKLISAVPIEDYLHMFSRQSSYSQARNRAGIGVRLVVKPYQMFQFGKRTHLEMQHRVANAEMASRKTGQSRFIIKSCHPWPQ